MPATTPILFPSGEDANPLHKRLPAEVVTRRPRPQAKVAEEKPVDEVKVDLKSAVALKPDARPKWLMKACKMAEEGRASTTELYNIITSRKFLGGLPAKIGRRLRDTVNDNIVLFSDKQQRFLRSDDWLLNAKYGENEKAGDEGDPEVPLKDDAADEDDAPREELKVDRQPEKPPERPPEKQPEKAKSKKPERREPERREPERREPEEAVPEKWVTAPAARGQEDRFSREAVAAEERARRKGREKEHQERWMEVEVETSRRRAQEQQEAKRRQLEDEADSSLNLLESLGQRPDSRPEPTRERRDDDGKRRGGLSRSRSIRMRSRSRKRRDKSRGRRRRRSGSGSRPGVDFADALRRRMEEREANDTTRIPVVDPGHAARWASRS